MDAALFGTSPEEHDRAMGTGNFAAQMSVLARSKSPVNGLYAVVSSVSQAREYADFKTEFPLGFRLLRPPAEDQRLCDLPVDSLPGLQRNMPICLGGNPVRWGPESWKGMSSHEKERQSSDREGKFYPCMYKMECRSFSRCVGIADGWDSFGIRAEL